MLQEHIDTFFICFTNYAAFARSQNAQYASNRDVVESREAIVLKTAFTTKEQFQSILVMTIAAHEETQKTQNKHVDNGVWCRSRGKSRGIYDVYWLRLRRQMVNSSFS